MKIKERVFKDGERAWTPHGGFGTVQDNDPDNTTYPIFLQFDSKEGIEDVTFTEKGLYFSDDQARSLFTLEEAKEIFGVEPREESNQKDAVSSDLSV